MMLLSDKKLRELQEWVDQLPSGEFTVSDSLSDYEIQLGGFKMEASRERARMVELALRFTYGTLAKHEEVASK